MRLSHFLVILAAATVFASGEAAATDTTKVSEFAASEMSRASSKVDNVGISGKNLLRSLKTSGAGDNQEEERFNFSFLKKLKELSKLNSRYNKAMIAKAAEEARIAKDSKLVDKMLVNDDNLFSQFRTFHTELKTPGAVRNWVLDAGKSDDVASKIAVRYRDWNLYLPAKDNFF